MMLSLRAGAAGIHSSKSATDQEDKQWMFSVHCVAKLWCLLGSVYEMDFQFRILAIYKFIGM
jgi:hypothetical protein